MATSTKFSSITTNRFGCGQKVESSSLGLQTNYLTEPIGRKVENNWTRLITRLTDIFTGLVSIEEVEGSKHVLCAFICGPESIVMEHASDEEVAEGVTRVLRQFTGDASLPYPCTILRSKWASDPYFCGSYSFMDLTSNVGHQCDLSCPVPGSCDPVPPILLFAGEATCAGKIRISQRQVSFFM